MVGRSIAVLALVFAGCGSVAAAPSPTPSPTNFSKDGGVTMSIGDVDCAHKSATGEYCYVAFHVVNISDGFPVFTEADQLAYDLSGRAFRPDPAATAEANGDKPVTQRLPRGPAVTGILVYAMPAGDRIDHLVLHGQPGTPGETFTVSGR